MKQRSNYLITFFFNALYFVVIFAIALAISTLALARRLNSYQATNTPFVLQLQKEEIQLTTTVAGQAKKILVVPGQHVKKGDLLIQLTDQATTVKIATLDKVSKDNISAKTEAEVLKTLAPQFEIRAPKDGIVYKINVVEDAYVQSNTPVINMFSDDNVKLIGLVTQDQYIELIKQKRLDVFSIRREQIFSVKLDAVSRVIPATQSQASLYELYFQFVDPDDGASFIQGESVDVIAKSRDDATMKPSNIVTTFWNSLVTGK